MVCGVGCCCYASHLRSHSERNNEHVRTPDSRSRHACLRLRGSIQLYHMRTTYLRPPRRSTSFRFVTSHPPSSSFATLRPLREYIFLCVSAGGIFTSLRKKNISALTTQWAIPSGPRPKQPEALNKPNRLRYTVVHKGTKISTQHSAATPGE